LNFEDLAEKFDIQTLICEEVALLARFLSNERQSRRSQESLNFLGQEKWRPKLMLVRVKNQRANLSVKSSAVLLRAHLVEQLARD
jgi:hypothetical protein